jgi:hypothetical protein
LTNLPEQWKDAADGIGAKLVEMANTLKVAADDANFVAEAGFLPGVAPAPDPADVLLSGARKRDAAGAPTPAAKLAALEKQELLLLSVGQSAARVSCTLAQEIAAYSSQPQVEWTEEPLDWWRNNCARFPRLAVIARAVLCIQATSCESERVFSKTGILLEGRRSQLASKNVDMMIFLHDNLDLLQEDLHPG